MIVIDDPQTGGASALISYMSRDGNEIRGPSGLEMGDDELDQFLKKSEEYDFTRHFILAPEGSHLSEKEIDRAARKSMTEWTADHDTTQWCYAVHQDPSKERPDVHVAATASKDSGDLWFETNDPIRQLRDDIAADHFRDHTTERQRQMMIEQGREDELHQEERERRLAEKQRDQNRIQKMTNQIDQQQHREQDQKQEQKRGRR